MPDPNIQMYVYQLEKALARQTDINKDLRNKLDLEIKSHTYTSNTTAGIIEELENKVDFNFMKEAEFKADVWSTQGLLRSCQEDLDRYKFSFEQLQITYQHQVAFYDRLQKQVDILFDLLANK